MLDAHPGQGGPHRRHTASVGIPTASAESLLDRAAASCWAPVPDSPWVAGFFRFTPGREERSRWSPAPDRTLGAALEVAGNRFIRAPGPTAACGVLSIGGCLNWSTAATRG
ncbi:hypothetical protein GCM10023237_07650 [Streptomyces coeruleoprunus]